MFRKKWRNFLSKRFKELRRKFRKSGTEYPLLVTPYFKIKKNSIQNLQIILVCDQINDKNFVPLKCLIEGSINVALNNAEFGEQVLFSIKLNSKWINNFD